MLIVADDLRITRPAILEAVNRENPAPLQAVVRRCETEVVGYLLGASGRVPVSLEERLAVALELIEACRSRGLPAERLIIDPVVAPLSWPDGKAHNRAVLAFLQRLPDLASPSPRTIAGLSNLTSGQPDDAARRVVQSVFLSMLGAAGLDMLLMDFSRPEVVRAARCCSTLLADTIFAWEEIGQPPAG